MGTASIPPVLEVADTVTHLDLCVQATGCKEHLGHLCIVPALHQSCVGFQAGQSQSVLKRHVPEPQCDPNLLLICTNEAIALLGVEKDHLQAAASHSTGHTVSFIGAS